MSCGKSLKNRYMKSCARYYSNTPIPFTAGSTTQLTINGSKVVDTGVSIDAQNMSYGINTKGLYHFSGDIVLDVATTGTAVFSVYMDGVQLPCTIKPLNLPEGQFPIHTETDLYLDSCCCDVNHSFTYVLTSTTAVGNITNICTGIIKEA